MAKRLLLTLALALLPCLSMAQVMAVADFHLDAADQTANAAATMVYDQNGEVCALIRIQTTQKGFVFDVGSMGVTKVDENHVGEVWAYLPHGVKRITIRHQQLGTLQDYYFPIAIEKARTYVMQLTTGKVTTVVEQAVTQQYVVFQVTPKDALVTLDGQTLAVTDGTAQAYKDFGTYDYRVECYKYHPEAGHITVDDPDNKVKKVVSLKPAYGYIAVEGSSAQGAQLYVDKAQQGTLPLQAIEATSGQHAVSLVKPLYKTFETTVTVRDGETTRLSPTLQPDFAQLTLAAGDNVEIWVNGERRGTSRLTDNFATGSYLVETKLSHHRTASQSYRVDPSMNGQTLQLPTPTPITGTLDITSTPALASIAIDGVNRGETPMKIRNLLEGTHTVTLTLEGYGTETREVTIQESQSATLTVTLQNGRPITISTHQSGAHIFVDNVDMGISPFSGTLTYGQHTLHATLNGQQSASKTITVSQGSGALPSVVLSFANGQNITVGGVTFKMVYVEGGTFTMGATSNQGSKYDSNEKPTHSVTLSSYYIGETEVTQALWWAVMGSNPSNWKGNNLPVEQISYDDCQKFIRKLNRLTGRTFRLPTEAEWEYAARGGNKSRGYKYSGSNTLSDVAWNYDNSGNKTHPVKIKSPNELGLYDMSGNVWEWCQDWYDDYSSSSQTNPKGPSTGSNRVYRGGGWLVSARNCRVSLRGSGSPSSRYYYIGLRLVMEP